MTQTQSDTHAANNFDALRLIAAWLVIVGHSYELLGKGDPLQGALHVESLGAIGVIMFFSMSGYLVTHSLLRSHSIGDFLWRRALRVLPALWVLIAISVFIWGAAMTRFDPHTYYTSPTTHDYLGWMWLRVRHYLPGTFENNPLQQGFNGSLWTLPLETRCYVALALCALAGKKFIKPLACVLLIALFVCAYRHFDRGVFRVRYFSIDSYLFLKLVVPFFIGSAIALWGSPRYCNIWVGLVACVAVVFGMKSTSGVDAFRWFIFAIVVGYFALALALHTQGWLSGFTQRGDFSYGMYLYAFPIQQSLIALTPEISVFNLILATTFFSGVCGWLSWRFVEKPMLQEKGNLLKWKAGFRGAFTRTKVNA
jgi:peptidoglycan/LPS O-acetylase OafA/YrhL